MEFGKVAETQLDSIDFRLPIDDPRSWMVLNKQHRPEKTAPRLHIGCPIWSAKSWLGTVYPLGTSQHDFLFHYSRQFTGIELNTTHYRIPDDATIERWRESTPPGFTFSPKWPQAISHHSPLIRHTSEIKSFVHAVLGLEEKLGLTFLQLPPHFAPQDLPDLDRFLASLPAGFPIAIEFRHPGFFLEHMLHSRAFDILERRGARTVITDVAGRRDVLHTSLTGSGVIVRLIGNDLHPSDDQRIEEWTARLSNWIRLGLSDAYFFLHEPSDANMPEFVARFTARLNQKTGLHLPIWKRQDQGAQLDLF
jgi:uncharacterized protein YecE (DUF72 family)